LNVDVVSVARQVDSFSHQVESAPVPFQVQISMEAAALRAVNVTPYVRIVVATPYLVYGFLYVTFRTNSNAVG